MVPVAKVLALAAGIAATLPVANVAEARTVAGALVSTVHSGETPGINVGNECFFQIISDPTTWWAIPKGPAAATNCAIVKSAFLTNTKVYFDVNPATMTVTYLCITRNGSGC